MRYAIIYAFNSRGPPSDLGQAVKDLSGIDLSTNEPFAISKHYYSIHLQPWCQRQALQARMLQEYVRF